MEIVREPKEKVFVWDGVNSDLEEFDTLKEAKDWIKETFIDEEDGIHPEIESVFIMKRTHEIVVNALDEEECHEVKFNEL
jgi:hypothetical protein